MLIRPFLLLSPAVCSFRKRWSRYAVLRLAAVFLPLVFCCAVVIAQAEAGDEPRDLPPPVHYDGQPVKDGPPNPDPLRTRDGVQLVMTYYPSTKGKDTLPVILLHDRSGKRADYSDLAVRLQSLRYAVIVPDLRGHGESTRRTGSKVPLNADTLSRAEFAGMVLLDMERVKEFLIKKNNAGELNIEKLCVVGAGMGAAVALNWARLDWSHPPVGPGTHQKKQGQDVKALVLLSPTPSTPGLPLSKALAGPPLRIVVIDRQLTWVFKDRAEMELPTFKEMQGETARRRLSGLPPKNYRVELDYRREVSVLIAVGKNDSKAAGHATRLYTTLKRYHPDPPPAERAAKRDLFYGKLDTRLQGTEMLNVPGLNLQRHITRFIELRVLNRSFPWAKRGGDPYAGKKED